MSKNVFTDLGLMELGIYLSSQVLITLPSPTSSCIPLITSPLVPNQLFHNHESFPFCLTCNISYLGKYFSFSTRDIGKFGYLISRQTCLASIVSLTDLRSLNSIPSSIFFSDVFSHLAQWIFLISSISSHKQSAILFSISLQSELGNL